VYTLRGYSLIMQYQGQYYARNQTSLPRIELSKDDLSMSLVAENRPSPRHEEILCRTVHGFSSIANHFSMPFTIVTAIGVVQSAPSFGHKSMSLYACVLVARSRRVSTGTGSHISPKCEQNQLTKRSVMFCPRLGKIRVFYEQGDKAHL
jgi:hypothetical protein